MKKWLPVLILSLIFICFCTQVFAKKKITHKVDTPEAVDPRSPLSVDHITGKFSFVQSHANTFINGYIEFSPDHNWTLVVHFDDDRDRITDRFRIFKGTFEIRKVSGEPKVVIHENDREDDILKDIVFADRRIRDFKVRGFSFTRRMGDSPLFDHTLNVAVTATELKITSNPPGAIVFLDGVKVEGNTPLIIKKPPAGRQITVRVEMVEFGPTIEHLTLKKNETKELNFHLVQGEAEFWIATTPWTRVMLDGNYKGNAPIKLTNLNTGKHTVHLVNSGAGIDDVFEIDLPENQIIKKQIRYTGKLDIFVGQEAQIVDKDGKVLGKAPVQGLDIPVGNNMLRLVNDQKKMKLILVKIKLDQVTTFNKDWDDLQDHKD